MRKWAYLGFGAIFGVAIFLLYRSNVDLSARMDDIEASDQNIKWAIRTWVIAWDRKSQEQETRIDGIENHSELSPALISPKEKKYALARNNLGVFPVAVAAAEPYLDGYKVRLNIGNPFSVDLLNGSLAIRWGKESPELEIDTNNKNKEYINKTIDDFEKNFRAWDKSLRATKIEILRPISAGRWNTVEVILPSCKADEISYMAVTVSFGGMYLSGPN